MDMLYLLESLKKKRKSFSYSEEEISRYLGISVESYQQIESGLIDITLKELLKLCELFKIKAVDLMNEATESYKKKPSLNISEKIMNLKKQGLLDVYEAEEISEIKKKVDQIWELLNHKEKNNLELEKNTLSFAYKN